VTRNTKTALKIKPLYAAKPGNPAGLNNEDMRLQPKDNISGKKVSIILPTFNGSKYLGRSIKSCLDQTHKNLELIVIDDCSTDPGTLEAISSFKDGRIRYYKNAKNLGISSSLNIGFEKSCGDCLTWTSDDNFFEKNAIEKMLSYLLEKSEKFVYSSYYSFNGDDESIKSVVRFPGTENLERNCIACFLFDREVFKSVGGFDTDISFAQDTDYWLRVSKQFKLSFLDEPLYYYRIHNVSISMSNYKNFSYRVEAMLVQYKNNVLSIEKTIDNLVNARAGCVKENAGKTFFSDFILKNSSLYKSFVKKEIEGLLLKLNSKETGFAFIKTQIIESFDIIDRKLADEEELKKISSSAILDIKNVAVARKTVTALLKYLIGKDSYDLFADLRMLLYSLIKDDHILLNNIIFLELSYNLKKTTISKESIIKLKDSSNSVFIEPEMERDAYLNLAGAVKPKLPEYYYYMLKALVINLIIAKSSEEITDFIDFFDDFNTRKFLYERALSLAYNNNSVAAIQEKIQGLYIRQLI